MSFERIGHPSKKKGMASTHLYHFGKQKPLNQNGAGARWVVDVDSFPMLEGMSLYKLRLEKGAAREPHWHANADELGYCLQGKALVLFYASGNVREEFLVEKGDVFFIPSGALHTLVNVGSEPAEFILQFSNEKPKDFALSTSFHMFTPGVLGNTWGVAPEVFEALKNKGELFFAPLKKLPALTDAIRYNSPYRYSLDASMPLAKVSGGSATVARADHWPILQRQALYHLTLTTVGMREPHWHPETAEMGYVQQGKGRMSILSPSGSIDTYEMAEGDVYFIPHAYPHHIENLGADDLKILIFFDRSMPGDVGFTGSLKAQGEEVLEAFLDFPKGLPNYYEDLLIVDKYQP